MTWDESMNYFFLPQSSIIQVSNDSDQVVPKIQTPTHIKHPFTQKLTRVLLWEISLSLLSLTVDTFLPLFFLFPLLFHTHIHTFSLSLSFSYTKHIYRVISLSSWNYTRKTLFLACVYIIYHALTPKNPFFIASIYLFLWLQLIRAFYVHLLPMLLLQC